MKSKLYTQLTQYEAAHADICEQELRQKEAEHESADQTLRLFLEELYLTMKDNLRFKR